MSTQCPPSKKPHVLPTPGNMQRKCKIVTSAVSRCGGVPTKCKHSHPSVPLLSAYTGCLHRSCHGLIGLAVAVQASGSQTCLAQAGLCTSRLHEDQVNGVFLRRLSGQMRMSGKFPAGCKCFPGGKASHA